MPRTNASNVEVAARVDEILALRLDGLQFHDLRALAVQKGWGVRERTLWSYLKRADMLIRERAEEDRDALFGRHLAQRRALYARCLNAADYSTALRVLDSECELLGLFPPKNPPASNPNVIVNVFKRAAALAQQLRDAALPARPELDCRVPQGAVPEQRGGKSVDTAHADGETVAIPLGR